MYGNGGYGPGGSGFYGGSNLDPGPGPDNSCSSRSNDEGFGWRFWLAMFLGVISVFVLVGLFGVAMSAWQQDAPHRRTIPTSGPAVSQDYPNGSAACAIFSSKDYNEIFGHLAAMGGQPATSAADPFDKCYFFIDRTTVFEVAVACGALADQEWRRDLPSSVPFNEAVTGARYGASGGTSYAIARTGSGAMILIPDLSNVQRGVVATALRRAYEAESSANLCPAS